MPELNSALKMHLAELGLTQDSAPQSLDDWHAFLDRVNATYTAAEQSEKQTAVALSDAQRRLALLTDRNPLAFIEWSSDYHIIEWNPAAERIFGYTRAEALKLRDVDLVTPAYYDLLEFHRRQNHDENHAFQSINENITKDGRTIICEWNNLVLADEQGNRIGLAAIVQDVTEIISTTEALRHSMAETNRLFEAAQKEIEERRRTEEALRQSQTRVSLLRNNSVLIMVEWDAEFNVVAWNRAAERTFGYTWQEAVDYGFIDLIVPRNAWANVEQVLKDLRETNEVVHSVNENITKDGKIIVCEWYNVPLIDSEGNKLGYAAMALDITERRQAEEDLKRAKESAEIANRAKSTFLATMSHELRTPLNAILGYAQLMERDSNITPPQQGYLKIISRSGEHLLNLINDVLEMSKIEAGRAVLTATSFDLHRLLDNLEVMLRVRTETKGLSLSFAYDSTLPRFVRTDEGKLRQVLINLLGNAIKFTPSGGVTLTARVIEIDDVAARLGFEVADTGDGIPPEDLDSIFDAFVRSDTPGKMQQEGTGLGLAITRQFVGLMGGSVTVHSDKGKGSTFSFDIQVELTMPMRGPASLQERRVIGLEPGQLPFRILVADDQREGRELVGKLLGMVGFDVREVEDGQQAVTASKNWMPNLIFMDMRMPVMDGYEATRAIKADLATASIIVIALTASAFEHERSEVLAAGCNDFIAKPYREGLIFAKLTQYLGVRYIYDKNDPVSSPRVTRQALLPSALKDLPAEALALLQQGADEINAKLVWEATSLIRPNNAPLADALNDLVARHRFDQLQRLLDQANRKVQP